MKAKGPRQGKTFRVSAFADQILNLVPVADGNGGLLNDRAVIQIFGDVMGCSTDELDPTVPGPVIQPITSPKIWMMARSLSKPPFPSAIGTKWRI